MISRLLYLANADPPTVRRKEFYDLKERLLARYGTRVLPDHVQEIRKDCWGPQQEGCAGRGCRRCGGSGVWDHFFVRLERHRWGKYEFHRPAERRCRPSAAPDIRGYVRHREGGSRCREALLWLCLLVGEWRMLLRLMVASCYSNPGRRPLCQLNRLTFWAWMKRPRRCADCARWALRPKGCPARCPACWRRLFGQPAEAALGDSEELPF